MAILTDAILGDILIDAVRKTNHEAFLQIIEAPEFGLHKIPWGPDDKPTLILDLVCDFRFSSTVHGHPLLGDARLEPTVETFVAGSTLFPVNTPIRVIGEERYKEQMESLKSETRPVFISDPIAGSDLLERGLSNWCTAAVAFRPNQGEAKIVCAAVAVHPGIVYAANSGGPYRHQYFGDELKEKPRELRGTTRKEKLDSASICYYGQKIENFASLSKSKLAASLFERNEKIKDRNRKKEEEGRLDKEHNLVRIYNLAGIPMMMKLADFSGAGNGIDAVIELKGQQIHDVVPGLYIAIKAGACAKDLEGKRITIEYLEEKLLQPDKTKLSYVLASTEELADEILNCL